MAENHELDLSKFRTYSMKSESGGAEMKRLIKKDKFKNLTREDWIESNKQSKKTRL